MVEIAGLGGADTLVGSSGADAISGGAGADEITPGPGADSITTGAGSDVVVYNTGDLGAGVDSLGDFTLGPGGDVLDIADLLVGYTPGTSDITDFVQIVDSGADSIVRIDPNGTGASFTDLATIVGQTGLDEATLLADGNIDPVV